jgi:hypothetical protein
MFNALCLFIIALFCAVFGLIGAAAEKRIQDDKNKLNNTNTKKSIHKNEQDDKNKLNNTNTKKPIHENEREEAINRYMNRGPLFLGISGILLIAGLAVLLLQVVCKQLDQSVSNCQAASWGLIGIFIFVAAEGIIVTIIALCRKPKKIEDAESQTNDNSCDTT